MWSESNSVSGNLLHKPEYITTAMHFILQYYILQQSVYTHSRPCDVRLPFDYTHGPKIIKHTTLLFLSFSAASYILQWSDAPDVSDAVFHRTAVLL